MQWVEQQKQPTACNILMVLSTPEFTRAAAAAADATLTVDCSLRASQNSIIHGARHDFYDDANAGDAPSVLLT